MQLRTAGAGVPGALPDSLDYYQEGPSTRPPEIEGGKNGQVDAEVVAETVAHLKDFGITTFAQVAALMEEGLQRRLGRLGIWVYQVSHGEDLSLVVPDAPPLSQNARVHFRHAADADETCTAIRKLANYLSERLKEQRLKGQSLALILWPNNLVRRETRKLVMSDEGDEMAVTTAEETLGGQMQLSRHTDEADVIAHHSLMLFAHYHHPAYRYLQVQLRIGDIISTTPNYYPPPARTRGRPTRKL
jgi:nucleotidyltransferase/DNA polymerase involved in DNA repair